MKQIRNNVFETNSSSTHSIAISKKAVENYPKCVHFGKINAGWEVDEITDTADYLYTAIVNTSCPHDYELTISRLEFILNKHNIKCKFDPVKYCYSKYSPLGYCVFKHGDGIIDHVSELSVFIDQLLNNEDLLLRYLFGNTTIYTGNDNSCDESDMCYCAEKTIWTDEGCVPNYNHDSDKYDYYFKGN